MEKQFIKRVICFLIGCFIIQVGAACFINANTGGDSSVVLIQGISNILNISVGVANYIFMFVALILLLLFARDKISLGTFLAAFGSGIFLDLANMVIKNLSIESLPFIIRVLTVPVSCVIIAIGFSIQKTANLGVAPHDEIPFLIVEFTKVQYRWIRITLDVSYIVIGFLMGGVFGLGTIVATMCIGPSIQYFLPKVEKPIEKFINGNAELISE
ncbi:YczE/YyaS/YitT family protein [Clostridium saudiense]|uniref:YczE/YyaS/YitT family protein n=1 Tax=Clostridium saudiense TaxID=1414720 RepID=UPI0018AB3292|nr:membrane protein [Clostridium saudiense]